MNKILLIGSLMVVFPSYAQNFDHQTLKAVNKQNALHQPMFYISQSATILPFAVPAGVCATGLIMQNNQITKDGFYLLGSIAISSIFTTIVKNIAQRQRPFNTYTDIQKLDSGGSFSFPSGHTSAAFTLATSLSLTYRKWYVIAPAFLWAASVGYSRMNLGVHYPSDVVIGGLVGVASAYATYQLNQWIYKKYNPRIFKER